MYILNAVDDFKSIFSNTDLTIITKILVYGITTISTVVFLIIVIKGVFTFITNHLKSIFSNRSANVTFAHGLKFVEKNGRYYINGYEVDEYIYEHEMERDPDFEMFMAEQNYKENQKLTDFDRLEREHEDFMNDGFYMLEREHEDGYY